MHFSDQSSLEWAGIQDVCGGEGGDKAGEVGRGPIREVIRYHAMEDGLYVVSTEEVLKGFLSKINKIIFQNLPLWTQSSWLKLLPPTDNFKVSIKPENALKPH